MKILIWTDGSATTAENSGGWAWVLEIDGKFFSEGSGHLEKATNNDAELIACLKGLEAALTHLSTASFPIDAEVVLRSDSKLVLGWADGTYRFKQAEKMFLYEELRRLVKKLKAKTEWVPGHAGYVWNERCDKLANEARLNQKREKDKENAKINGKSLIGKKRDGVACLWYKGKLKVVDFSTNVCEDYDRELHGKRGSMIEIREEKLR